MWSSPFAAMCANNPGYPPTRSGFLAMKARSESEERLKRRQGPFWNLMIPFACGPYCRGERRVDREVEAALSWMF